MELLFILVVDLLASLDRTLAGNVDGTVLAAACVVGPFLLVAVSVVLWQRNLTAHIGLLAAAASAAVTVNWAADRAAGVDELANLLVLTVPAAGIALRFAAAWPWTPPATLLAAALPVALVVSGALLASQALLVVLVALALCPLATAAAHVHGRLTHA